MPIQQVDSGGQDYVSYRITNAADKCQIAAMVTNFGAAITHLMVPDHNKVPRDVVMGFDNVADYTSDASGNQYFGCTVGRTANRTAEGKLSLDGADQQLTVNNGPNHLHGGKVGFDKRLWSAEPVSDSAVKFTLISDHLDEGYPGNLRAEVTYEVTSTSSIRISYSAKLLDEQPAGVDTTVVNMTHHSYFNLSGGLEHDILDHVFWTPADRYIPVDGNLVPTGELASCLDVPSMDFKTAPRRLGEKLEEAPGGGGYDHCLVLPPLANVVEVAGGAAAGGPAMQVAGRAVSPTTGIMVEMRTTEPGFQLYSGNFVDGTASCKQSTQAAASGVYKYVKYSGFCIEASKFPNAVNQPEWREQVLLGKGQEYQQVTEYRFSTLAPKEAAAGGGDDAWAACLSTL